MHTFKPTGAELERLQSAAKKLKAGNAKFGEAKKDTEAAKAAISDWLKTERNLDLTTLPIGEMVQIDGVALVEITSMNKFDEKSFLLSDPTTHAKFKKDFTVTKYKPLV